MNYILLKNLQNPKMFRVQITRIPIKKVLDSEKIKILKVIMKTSKKLQVQLYIINVIFVIKRIKLCPNFKFTSPSFTIRVFFSVPNVRASFHNGKILNII